MGNRLISRKSKLLFATTVVCAGLYLGSIVWRCTTYYDEHGRWSGSAYGLDKDYGYFPKPYELAYQSLKYGERVPVLFDENGFRIPYGEEKEHPKTPELQILFLGDSFTHGYGVPAEETFAYLTADALDAQAMNAGGSGWGLSQMAIRARDVIPRLKPDLVVVQYSNWLPSRSLSFYAPTRWGRSPAPYFYESEGTVDIHQPVFQSANFKVPISEFAGKGFLTFVWRVGIPLCIYDDYMALGTSMKRRVGLLSPPITSRQKAVEFAYTEIQELCSANNASMLIVVIPISIDDYPKDRLDASSWRIVHTLELLTRELPQPTQEAWSANYGFWRGTPRELVDKHPNSRMHAVIAEQLIGAIRDTKSSELVGKPEGDL